MTLTSSLFGLDIKSSQEQNILNDFSILVAGATPGSTVNTDISRYLKWDGESFSEEDVSEGKIISLKTSFSLSSSVKDDSLGIYIGPTPYACDIFINGYHVFRSGQSGKEWISGGFLSDDFILPGKALFYDNRDNILTVEIHPNGFSEPFPDLVLSNQKTASNLAFKRNFFSVYLIRATSFTSIVLAAYYLLLFFTSGLKEKRFLFFALLCIAFFVSYLEISFASNSVSDLLIKKFSKIGFTLLLIFLTTFVVDFSKLKKVRKPAILAVSVPGIIFIIILSLNQTHISVDSTLNLMLSFYFPVIILLNLFIAVYTAFKKRSPDNFVLLLALLGAIACALSDIFVILFSSIPYTYLTPYGFLLIIFALFLILTFEQLRTSRQNKEQALSLAEKNKLQREIFQAITELSGSIQQSGARLNDKISESSQIIAGNSAASREMNTKIREQISTIETTLPVIRKNLGESAERIFSALTNQGAYAEEVNTTLTEIISKLQTTGTTLQDTSKAAGNLNSIASGNRSVIEESSKALNEIQLHSRTIHEVLKGIEDITAKTDLLAMNASIEAAHAGEAGKGFAVVAAEVRNLANQSNKQISDSNKKLQGMEVAIKRSAGLSTEVSEGLHSIIEEALRSSDMMNKTSEEMELQQTNITELLHSVQSLIEDTVTIKGLSEENRKINSEVQQTLEAYRTTLMGFTELIDIQERKIEELNDNMSQIQSIFSHNLKSTDNLKNLLLQVKK